MSAPIDVREEFSSLAEWCAFAEANRAYLDRSFLASVAEGIRESGLYFTFGAEHAAPESVVIDGENYRESIVFRQTNSRQRAVLDELLRCLGDRPPHLCKIYAPEAVSEFAMLLRRRFVRFVGSEYTEDPSLCEQLYPIPVESLLRLSLKSDSFHAVIVNDIFEHIPNIPRALGELARILEPSGHLISTFPFLAFVEPGLVKARLTDSGIEYLMDPEYHPDPISRDGALVFEIPGWDILNQCRSAGFSQARMVYILSQRCGILAPGYGGIFVLVARK